VTQTHRRTPVQRRRRNGFAKRFNHTVDKEFLQRARRENLRTSLEELQADLHEWLQTYSYERSRKDCRNMGHRPIETV